MQKMIIEARVNEYAGRDANPHVPWTADEIADTAVRCREAGASILHYHARAADGSPLPTVEENARIIRKVRAACDILILPTLGFTSNDGDPAGRIQCMLDLAKDRETRPDIVPIATGSANFESYDSTTRSFQDADEVYINSTETLIDYARKIRAAGMKPKLSVWSIGFMRRAIALIEAGFVDEPAYFLLHMTAGSIITGHPGTAEGLGHLAAYLPKSIPHYWTANVVGGNLIGLAERVAMLGGNLAPGLGDHPYSELGAPTNEELVGRCAQICRATGREIATPDDVREMLHLSSR